MSLLTQLFDVTALCVKNNTILTQMLNTKDPLCREQYNIYIDAWKQKTLCVENNTIFTQYQNCGRTVDFCLLKKLTKAPTLSLEN